MIIKNGFFKFYCWTAFVENGRVVRLFSGSRVFYPYRWSNKRNCYDGLSGHFTLSGLYSAYSRGSIVIM